MVTRQQININTLDVTQSVILEALFDPWLSPVQARALLQQRPAKGWEDVDQFLAQPLLADVDERTKKQLKTVLSVDSNYFWLRSDITVNEIELTMNSLIVRMGPPALPSRRTGCPFLVGLWLAMHNGLSAASMNAGDGAPGWRWLRSCSAPSSMSRIYRFR